MCDMRRNMVAFIIATGVGVTVAPVCSQHYPTRPVRVVVPTSTGAFSDFAIRSISHDLTQRLGQTVVVDNRAGGGTMIGTEIVAKSAPDGHTLLMGGP